MKTLIEKGEKKMHPIERLSYKVAEMYALEKANRKTEALQWADEIVKEIIDTNVND